MSDSAGFGGFAGERQLEALGRVASVIAHELTNLLQILASSLDRLALGHDPDDVTVRTVRASLDRGTRLARQLQTFAQTTPPRLEAREIHQLIAGWMPDFEEAIGPDRRLELRLRHSGAAMVDEDQIETALTNLLANARDASGPDGVIVIELAKSEQPAGGPGCRIAVIDHGEGMPDDVARQAAAPFFTTRAPGKGMGLGLTIARMVAEAHGGALEVDTAFGRGTTVSVFLPAVGADTRASDARNASQGSPAASSSSSSGARHSAPGSQSSAGTASSGQGLPGSGLAGQLGTMSGQGLPGQGQGLPGQGTTGHVPTPGVYAPPMQSGPSHSAAPPREASPHLVSPRTDGGAPSQDFTHAPGDRMRDQPSAAPIQPGSPHTPAGRSSPFAHGPSAGAVLVVDDEEAIADYFRIILTADRYDVHVVTSAHQALDRFAQDPQRYDAVLLDMMLRDGSGIDLYRKFRQLRPDLAVVVCTGFSDNDSLAPIRADGHDVLFKPCPRGDVLRAMARAVARRRASSA